MAPLHRQLANGLMSMTARRTGGKRLREGKNVFDVVAVHYSEEQTTYRECTVHEHKYLTVAS
jgi:hypothetical protein